MIASILDMILEVAILDVKENLCAEFEVAFSQAEPLICAIPGYINHELHKCIEVPQRYLLLVGWEKLEDHTIGFRQSPEYQEWKKLLHHFYEPFPNVEHFEKIF